MTESNKDEYSAKLIIKDEIKCHLELDDGTPALFKIPGNTIYGGKKIAGLNYGTLFNQHTFPEYSIGFPIVLNGAVGDMYLILQESGRPVYDNSPAHHCF